MSTESELRQSDQMEELLDKHAEYYIRETMKFFQNKGESPALSRNNDGDCEAKASIQALITRRKQEAEARGQQKMKQRLEEVLIKCPCEDIGRCNLCTWVMGELEVDDSSALTNPTPADSFDPSQVSLCPSCNAMTHTIMSDTKGDEDYCGKCGKLRSADIPTKTEDEK